MHPAEPKFDARIVENATRKIIILTNHVFFPYPAQTTLYGKISTETLLKQNIENY